MQDLIERVFDLTPDIRYVAAYRNGRLQSAQRPGVAQASTSESDKYEELIVNPTLLTLTRQRGKSIVAGWSSCSFATAASTSLCCRFPAAISPSASSPTLIPFN